MTTPECRCWTDKNANGNERSMIIGTEVGLLFMDALREYQICHKAGEYVMVTAVALMMRSVADATMVREGEAAGRALFQEYCTRLVPALIAREAELQEQSEVNAARGETRQ